MTNGNGDTDQMPKTNYKAARIAALTACVTWPPVVALLARWKGTPLSNTMLLIIVLSALIVGPTSYFLIEYLVRRHLPEDRD